MNGTFNGAQGFIVAQQKPGWYIPHIFADETHFRAWMKRERPRNIIKATAARGRCVRGIDHRYNEEENPKEGTDMQTNQSQALAEAARTSTPAPAQSPLPGTELKTLDLLARLTSSNDAQLATLREIRSALGVISGKLELLIDRTEGQPAPAVASNGNGSDAAPGNYTDFDAEAITVGTDDNGKPVYKIKGGQFSKWGVRVWPEVLPMLGVDVDDLKPGPNQFTARVRALVDDKGQARKVIGLAK